MPIKYQRESFSKIYLTINSVIGWTLILLIGIIPFSIPTNIMILLLLVTFLFLTEYFPIPVWKGFTTVSFPILYVIYVLYDIHIAITLYALVALVINFIEKRPIRVVLFNPAQLSISLFMAHLITTTSIAMLEQDVTLSMPLSMMHFLILSLCFYLLNNTLTDIVLLIRPQKYPFSEWKHKIIAESNSFLIAFGYSLLFYILANQNRGEIDVVSFFFFFSPLVSIALLSSVIFRLKQERNRLKTLFSITSDLNSMVLNEQWLTPLTNALKRFVFYEGIVVFLKQQDEWKSLHAESPDGDTHLLHKEFTQFLQQLNHIHLYNGGDKEAVESRMFPSLSSILFVPLKVDREMVGMLVIGRIRKNSFTNEEVQTVATLANQLAVIWKTRDLVNEKERRTVLEERNRIAREIHDGIAQTLAGAVMNLDVAQRKLDTPATVDAGKSIINKIIPKLRGGLKEVKESIFALRPYPTERVGLIQAIYKRIELFSQSSTISFPVEIRGKETNLPPLIERVLFDIFQESIHNATKHASPTTIQTIIHYKEDRVILKIRDDGIGFSLYEAMVKARKEPHLGILNMNEAAEQINGTLHITSKENRGTEVSIQIQNQQYEEDAAW